MKTTHFNTGKKRTLEQRSKLSAVVKQNFKDGVRKSWNKGRKGLPSGKKGKSYPHLQGESSPKWKGGMWAYWRLQALVRDAYTCQSCFLTDPEIVEVDHIKSKKQYPELRFDLTNLVTLCPNCHVRKTKRNKEHAFKEKPL